MTGFLSRLFGKEDTQAPDLSGLVTDIHSHLIPGIDDGAETIEESLEIIRGMISLGIKKFVTTPHIMSDSFRNTPENIGIGLDELRKALVSEGLEIEIQAAAEYYLDEVFMEMIDNEELLTFGGDNKYLLFETSYVSQPMSFGTAIFKLIGKGYKPVLAHPERYNYFWDDGKEQDLLELKEKGLLFQVNLGSFAGHYSVRAKKIAEFLSREEAVDFLGSDIHRARQLVPIQRALDKSKELAQLLESRSLLNQSL